MPKVTIKFGRWYKHTTPGKVVTFRQPTEFSDYDSGVPGVAYITGRGTPGRAPTKQWRRWQTRTELMPEDFQP